MKLFLFIILILPIQGYAQDLMEQKIFQVGSYSSFESFILKNPYDKKRSKYIDLNISGLMNTDLVDNINTLSSEDENEIVSFLDENFGKKQYALAHASLGINIKNFRQEFSVSAGALAVANNPIIPEVEGKIIENQRLTSSYLFNYNEFELTPKLSLGRRKYLHKRYTSGDILEDKVDLDFKNQEYKSFSEVSLLVNHKIGWVNLQSIPLSGYFPVDYWEVRVGSNYRYKKFNFFGSLSPLYAGNSDWQRQVVLGAEYDHLSWVKSRVFIQNQEFNGNVSIDLRYLSLDLYYLKQQFDNYEYSKTDQYGLTFSLKY